MASRDPDENLETEEETIHKKRARRVSFAETTAVHFFNRDEDSEATPDADAAKDDDNSKLRRSSSDEILELLQSSSSSSSSSEEFDGGGDDIAAVNSSFLRPMESPSSGSCFGSATSNDEDKFFGPVSADFIKCGRLLDSAASEDNHDVTMDSTAFSMHFHSLARSDSGAEFKTPTGMHGTFGDRTPGQTSTAAMVLTGARKRVSHSTSPADKVIDSGHSDDMSLVGENSHRYDYGKLPPELDMLLAEGSMDAGVKSPSSHVELSNSTRSAMKNHACALDYSGSKVFNFTDNSATDVRYITDMSNISEEAISVNGMNFEERTESITGAAINEHSNDVKDEPGSITPLSNHIQASFLLTNGILSDKVELDGQHSVEACVKFESPPSRAGPKLDHGQSFAGSISSLLAKRREIFRNSGDQQNAQLNSALLDKEFRDQGISRNALSTSVYAKSISRLKRLDTYPFVSASKAEANASRLTAPRSTNSTRKLSNSDYASKDISITSFDAPIIRLDAQFSSVAKSEAQFRNESNITQINEAVTSSDAVDSGRIVAASSTGLSMQSITLCTDANSNELPLQVLEIPKKAPAFSLSPKEPCDLADDANLFSSVREDSVVEQNLMSRDNEYVHIIQNPSSVSKTDGTSSLKRKLLDRTEDHNDEMLFQHKPKLFKDEKHCERKQIVSHNLGSMLAVPARNGADVFTSFCRATNQLLSPVTDEFNVQQPCDNVSPSKASKNVQIERLNDVLMHLNKLKVYELHCELASQRAVDSSSLHNSKRLADTKSLLYESLYKKVKLQLLLLTRDKLLDHARQTKLMSSKHSYSTPGLKDIQTDHFQPESCSTGTDDRVWIAGEISCLRKEFEDSEMKINTLNKSFDSYVKNMNGLPYTKTVTSIKELLKKRVACQSMQSEMQLCRVEKLKAMRGHPSILFDHGGFFSQRFVVQSNSTAGLSISNVLNNAKISKVFLDIDVLNAFSFVFSGETHLPYESLTNIAQEVQKTGSLLHSLLDVIEEVQLATLELINLTWSRFHLPSAEKLVLQLCFVDFHCGAKVTLSIDVSCLKRGVYPSDVLPYEVTAARKCECHELHLADILTAVSGIKFGYMRITGICHCVSRLIQANRTD